MRGLGLGTLRLCPPRPGGTSVVKSGKGEGKKKKILHCMGGGSKIKGLDEAVQLVLVHSILGFSRGESEDGRAC